MHIEAFGCTPLPPLGHVRLNFDERVNLLIGPNASGKSTLLRAMEALYSLTQTDTSDEDMLNLPAYMEASNDWPRNDSHNPDSSVWNAVPLLYIPATRIHLPGRLGFDSAISTLDALESDAPLKDMFDTGSGIFDGSYVQLAIDWLRERLSRGIRGQDRRFRQALEIGYSCSKEICAEVIYDDTPHSYTDLDSEGQSSEVINIVHYGMGVVTTDNILANPMYAGVLSSGTQGTLLWIYALALKIVNHYGWSRRLGEDSPPSS